VQNSRSWSFPQGLPITTDTVCLNTDSCLFLFQWQVKCMINFIVILPQKLSYCLKVADDSYALLRATKRSLVTSITNFNNVSIFRCWADMRIVYIEMVHIIKRANVFFGTKTILLLLNYENKSHNTKLTFLRLNLSPQGYFAPESAHRQTLNFANRYSCCCKTRYIEWASVKPIYCFKYLHKRAEQPLKSQKCTKCKHGGVKFLLQDT